MNPIIHAELGWITGQPLRERRDRILVTVAGIAPDVDGLTLLAGQEAYGRWHHVLAHGFVAAGVTALVVFALARERVKAAALALVSFHLHLLCDLAGSGPGWPIHYYWPVNMNEWMWDGQWNLASWQNSLIGMSVTVFALSCALWFRRTPVEIFSVKADLQVVAALRKRFKRPA